MGLNAAMPAFGSTKPTVLPEKQVQKKVAEEKINFSDTSKSKKDLKTQILSQPPEKLVASSKSSNWFTRWLRNEDKVCTDGKDDGKLSCGEFFKSLGKGLMGFVKTAINHPIATGLTFAGAIGLNMITGGAAMIPMLALGMTISAATIGYGTYKYCKAETDGDAKAAVETFGNGLFGLVVSAFGAKAALNVGANAGVTSAQGAGRKSTVEAVMQVFKSTPEACKVGALNTKTNIFRLTNVISTSQSHSNVADANTAKFGFEIKHNKVDAFTKDLQLKPNEIGYRDVEKILRGLDAMHKTGRVNPAEYAKLANSVDPDLPSCYWFHAIRLYNKYATNAYPPKLNQVVWQYLNESDVETVNAGLFRFRFDPVSTTSNLIPPTVLSTTGHE